jgi:ribosomal protein L37AE/L43A
MECDPVICPHCRNDNTLLLEKIRFDYWRCEVCSKPFPVRHG